MGLIKITAPGKSKKLGIWHLAESVSALMKMRLLSGEELSVLATFSHDHRKKEWLISRILVEQLINEKNVRIQYDEYNKPSIKDSKLHLSLSHSHALLAAMVDENETGIDIELIKPNVSRIKQKFLNEKELRDVGDKNIDEKLTLYWCVKESLYKYYGKKQLTFKEHLIVEPLELKENGTVTARIDHSAMKKKFGLNYEKISLSGQDYMLAYIVNEV